jgi:hypothetical protein
LSQSTPFKSVTQNWFGTAVTTVGGVGTTTVEGSFEWDINFVINPNNSITGSATGKGSLGTQAGQDTGTEAPTGSAQVTGNYDPVSGNVNLVLGLANVQGAVDVASPEGGGSAEMQWAPTELQLLAPNWSSVLSPILHNLVQTDTSPSGQTETVTEQAGMTQADNTWHAPPVPMQDGGTVTKTITYPGITVTVVLTIHLAIVIQRMDSDTSSFITTDAPEFTVVVKAPGYDPSTANWSVQADQADPANPNTGPPSPANANGTSYFTFDPQSPSDNPITGSDVPNDPLQYKLQVTVGNLVATSELTQDEIDIIRQEYVDYSDQHPLPAFATGIPGHDSFAWASAPLNEGNYNYVLDDGLQYHINTVTQQFNQVAQGGVAISSGYRNPQKNVQVYVDAGRLAHCTWINSRHVWGRAVDLAPNVRNADTWQDLMNAGQVGTHLSQCEDGPNHKCDCDQTVPRPPTHVHIDW